MLKVLVQKRRNTKAERRLIRKPLSDQGAAPRVMVTDKLGSYGAANWKSVSPSVIMAST